jgi:hypothetical protein
VMKSVKTWVREAIVTEDPLGARENRPGCARQK